MKKSVTKKLVFFYLLCNNMIKKGNFAIFKLHDRKEQLQK